MKKCSICNIEKDINSFKKTTLSKKTGDWLRCSMCNDCRKQRYKESKKIAKDLAKKQDEAIKTGDIEAKKEIDKKVIEFEKTILPIMNNALKEIIDAYKANPTDVNKKALLSEYESLIEQIDFLNKNQHLFTGKSQYNKEILIGYRKKLINSLSDDDIAQYLKINTPKITFDENGVPKIETQPLNKDVADFIVSIALDRYTGWEKLDFKGVASDKFLLSFSTIDRVLEKLFNESGLISDSKTSTTDSGFCSRAGNRVFVSNSIFLSYSACNRAISAVTS